MSPLCVFLIRGKGRGSFTGVHGHTGLHTGKGPILSLVFCSHHFEILNNFLTRGPTFSFCTGTYKLYSQVVEYLYLLPLEGRKFLDILGSSLAQGCWVAQYLPKMHVYQNLTVLFEDRIFADIIS